MELHLMHQVMLPKTETPRTSVFATSALMPHAIPATGYIMGKISSKFGTALQSCSARLNSVGDSAVVFFACSDH